MRKIWDTPGGVHPPEHKAQSLAKPLHELPLPNEIILPVSQHLGAPAEPIVSIGDQVLRGQLIAEGKEFVSANVHASTSGTITAIEERPLPHASGFSGLCVVIKPDGEDRWIDLEQTGDYKQLNRTEILEKIQQAGIVGMGGAGFPTSIKLSTHLKINTLVINGTECEPYITADDMLMQISSDEILEGVLLLDHLLENPENILIAIEENKPKAIAAMQEAVKAVGNERIEVVPLPVKYPSGGEKQLLQMLTGIEIPSGKLPADIGAVCQNIATVLAAYRAVRFGEPLTARITTITGEAYGIQRNVIARIGTPVQHVLETHEYNAENASRLVMGGPMMGFTLLDSAAPIVKTTNCLLAPSLEESPPPSPAQACIRCGMCAEACPASLLPQQLYWYARAEDEEKLQAHNLFDCIECGACSYACPSHIPLVQYYRAAKGQIKKHALEKQQSDRARQRFEFHKERIEIEKAERAKAREEAAEKAKQRKLEKEKAKAEQALKEKEEQAKNSAIENPESKKENDKNPVPVKPPGDEQARLNRNLISTEERIKKLSKRAEELAESDPSQAESVRARIKEAEFKKQTILDKLAAFYQPADDKNTTAEVEQTKEEKPSETTTDSSQATDDQTAATESDIENLADEPSTHPTEVNVESSESPNSAKPSKDRDDMSPSERQAHDSSIAVIEKQLASTQQKLDDANPEDAEVITALKMSLELLNQRLKTAKENPAPIRAASEESGEKKEITPLSDVIREKDQSGNLSDAIFASMERVVETKRNESDNSLQGKLQQKINSLEARVHEAKQLLAENRDKSQAAQLTENVSKLEQKLDLSREALKELVEQDDENQ